MREARFRVEVFATIADARCDVVRERLLRQGFGVESVCITDNYLIDAEIPDAMMDSVASLLVQPVVQGFLVNTPYLPEGFSHAVEIGYLPGVTDNVSHTVRESIEDLLKRPLDIEKSVFSSTTYFFGGDLSDADVESIGYELHNPLIQRMKILSAGEYRKSGGMGNAVPLVDLHEKPTADIVDLDVETEELMAIAREGIAGEDGIRRGPLALDMASMAVIRDYFQKEKRKPTDIELESIAQTWSEHCKHTIFAAEIDGDGEGIFRRYIRSATEKIRRDRGDRDFCFSVFKDNSGGIEFDDDFIVTDKVETHNSPSALDPFGGAITGIVGVNRDTIGFGLAAKPVANRYGFCFADPGDDRPLYRDGARTQRLLSPRRIMEGVIHGVNVGGNTSGIPTPQGFVYFDERYKGKPLVFVGTVGIIPKTVQGKSSVEKSAVDGDCIVMVGGRVGRDGIHGATFSSEALSSGSPATAVQIGDPITQKKLSDAIVKEARDLGLYNSITDNGAGGLSCSVAEMARECGGFEVDLERVPLKYPGLSPWQIWVSESQERMTISVPEDRLDDFIDLMARRGVEATVIGRFTSSGRGIVRYHGEMVFDLDLGFLHDGLPRKSLMTKMPEKRIRPVAFPEPSDMAGVLREMAGRLNIASYEFISTQYDHEVQAGVVIKPLQGRGKVNGNATVICPVLSSRRGVVLSQGIYPLYSDIDPYRMAACSIDTAVRNAVAAGCPMDRLAILDNFCWCDSSKPERLWQLKMAAAACYDTAVAYGTPFISGKDSMFNDFRGYDESGRDVAVSIPPTLLVSSIGVTEDIGFCQTIDFKCPGDHIYLTGITGDECGGSEYHSLLGERSKGGESAGGTVPAVDTALHLRLYRAMEEALRRGLVASSISVERGGLGVAALKSSMAGMLGFELSLAGMTRGQVARNDTALFSESQGRILVSVAPTQARDFESIFADLPCGRIGTVSAGGEIVIRGLEGNTIVHSAVEEMAESYRSRFRGF
ncbi:MAG: phosphoribosylformylglycinamidine synthase [Spirochaetes bacterium]|nr:phosphoribosylformylglycinamidine synthase [Spirochaetota bacterium]